MDLVMDIILSIYIWSIIGFVAYFIIPYTANTHNLEEIFNPKKLYNSKNINVNWFGCLVLTTVFNLMCPIFSVGFWFYKLCTVHIKPRHEVTSNVITIPESGIGDLSDGYHTFNELYHHRAILFSVICNTFPDKVWKSKKHHEGDMFEGMFIVGIETPEGQATYHYDIDPYWDMFKVKELDVAPHWDGHSAEDAINRIASLSNHKVGKWKFWPGWIGNYNMRIEDAMCSECGYIHPMVCRKYGTKESPQEVLKKLSKYCPNCGINMIIDEVSLNE